MHTDDRWPYDAPQDDPLTALRIPVVGSAWPGWAYLAAFDASEGERPTDQEAAMIRSWTEAHIDTHYSATWKCRLLERPFDIDGAGNGIVLVKWAEDDWGYRRRSWQFGPDYWPGSPVDPDRVPRCLTEVLDRTHLIGEEIDEWWLAWKTAHPDVFGG